MRNDNSDRHRPGTFRVSESERAAFERLKDILWRRTAPPVLETPGLIEQLPWDHDHLEGMIRRALHAHQQRERVRVPARRRGRPRYEDDAPLLAEMHQLMTADPTLRPHTAAKLIIIKHGRRVDGGISEARSKAQRLALKYKNIYRRDF